MNERRKYDKAVHQLVHDLRNCIAPMRNALTLLERPDVDSATLAYARDLLQKQLMALETLSESMMPALQASGAAAASWACNNSICRSPVTVGVRPAATSCAKVATNEL